MTATSSGSATTYPSAFTSCTTTTPENSIYLGQMGSFTYTMHFSEPVNNIVIAISATGGTFNENFIFNTSAGAPQIGVLSTCFSVVNGNEILSGENSGNSGGGGEFVITGPADYTSLTITGSGGENGALLSICSNSIVPVICLAGDNAPALTAVSLSTGCFSSTADLGTIAVLNQPADAVLSWHSATPATAANRLSATVVTPGTYYAAFYDALNDCYGSQTTAIQVSQPSGNISAGPDIEICLGEAVTLHASGGGNYSWNHGINDGLAFYPTESGSYVLNGMDANNCPDNDEMTITVNLLPPVNAGPDRSVCPGTEIILNGSGASSYAWEKQILDGVAFIPAESGIYLVTGTDPNGCKNSDEVLVTVFPKPEASFFTGPEEIDELQPLAQTFNTSKGAVSWLWDFGDQSESSTEQEPEHSYPGAGNYTITLTVSNEFGCTDFSKQTLEIKAITLYYVPNSFTPNGDEHNNVFSPVFNQGFNPDDFELLVYNRWGELLFESHDPFVGWDGTYANRSVMPGTYSWIMGFRSPDSDKFLRLNGSVNLIK